MHQGALPRGFGQDAAEHLQFEQYLFVIFGNVSGGAESFMDHPHPSFAPLFHGAFQDKLNQIAVSTVHIYSLFIKILTNR